MTSDDFRKLVDQFNEQGKMNFLEGATEDQISQFEKDNDIVLIFGGALCLMRIW